ncbi:MAG: nucleoside hydrolase [Verrucomicrobiales bacterium]|nr:nucleoside hydrolase [Verrucomicrobiales bacterium]
MNLHPPCDPASHRRRRRLLPLLACGLFLAALNPASALAQPDRPRIPVIYDSDIGDDIDDTWALGLLLKSPELDVKLVVGDHGKPLYRTRLLAKFLERAGRTDIPIGMAMDTRMHGGGRQSAWLADYNLNRYPGRILPDGVQAIIDTIMTSPQPVTVIAVGPLPNIAAALTREPRIAGKARFVGMHGSVRRGYGNSDKIAAEYNVKEDPKACQVALSAAWPVTITPLDTCGIVQLKDADYARVRDSADPIARAIIENYRVWLDAGQQAQAERQSSILFDTVAVYLALSTDLCRMEDLKVRVTDEGFTVLDPAAKSLCVATEWNDLGAFHRWLAERLTSP